MTLPELAATYVIVRRAAGFKMEQAEYHLKGFVAFADARGDTHLHTETAIAWAATARSPNARYNRMQHLNIFARYIHLEDDRHEVPPSQVFAHKRHRRPPHIYTDGEVRALVEAAGRLEPAGSCAPETYATIFALLAVTGMRVREALRLRLGDLTADGLVVRQTKFNKSRLLPLHTSTRSALDAYRDRWRAAAEPEEPLFISRRRSAVKYSTFGKIFLRVARGVGLRPASGKVGDPLVWPRIHDLRHTFAVRNLESCPREHGAIGRHITALTTYLGHSSVASTSWYLHASPTLMTDIADACAAFDPGGDR
jgi:integrase